METEFWLAFARIHGVGAKRMQGLFHYFGSLEAAWQAPASALREVPGFGRELALAVAEGRKGIQPQALMAELERAGIWALPLPDADYPPSLKELPDPPSVLFGRGRWPVSSKAVAIVGTRQASEYGLRIARRLGRELASQGILVVSGLAKGIDAAAHQGALETGTTLAVLGCGPDRVYPSANRTLFHRILEQGTILSEYPPGTLPEPGHFPERNRIVSGLSAAVVVVEAGKRSGALITADLALEQGKEVLAIPGPVDAPSSLGTNRLISQGARLVSTAEEILAELGWGAILAPPALPPLEQRIYEALDETPQHLDELSRRLGMESAVVMHAMVMLELESLATRLPGQRYMRRS